MMTLLGGLSAGEFLKDYWQKKPLLIRGAVPGFQGLLDREELIELSFHEEAQSRKVSFENGKWRLDNGPFRKKDFRNLPEKWTLLIQGVNHFLDEAERLLLDFNFIPYSRLDDLMVSYAPDGGGVGPHFDSYDVFLLQGMGKRKWQISAQKDRGLVEDAPLKILRNFKPSDEWILDPGDMLYLPPDYAHNGVAVGESMTYSIGFKVPSHQELAAQFMVYLQDHFSVGGMYQDPDLEEQEHPAELGKPMLGKVSGILSKIKWGASDVENFLGTYLSEPKPHVFFDPPEKPLDLGKFKAKTMKDGLRLDLKSQMLFTANNLFINGERLPFDGCDREILMKLADARKIGPSSIDDQTTRVLHGWYRNGYIQTGG